MLIQPSLLFELYMSFAATCYETLEGQIKLMQNRKLLIISAKVMNDVLWIFWFHFNWQHCADVKHTISYAVDHKYCSIYYHGFNSAFYIFCSKPNTYCRYSVIVPFCYMPENHELDRFFSWWLSLSVVWVLYQHFRNINIHYLIISLVCHGGGICHRIAGKYNAKCWILRYFILNSRSRSRYGQGLYRCRSIWGFKWWSIWYKKKEGE